MSGMLVRKIRVFNKNSGIKGLVKKIPEERDMTSKIIQMYFRCMTP